MSAKSGKNILIVVAHNNFRDEEYKALRAKLEASGARITVTSTVTRDAHGSQGMKINPDLLIDEVDPGQYDAAVFIGGTGASQFWHDVKAHEIARVLHSAGKVVAASSHATATLATAGLLNDKTVTGHVAVYEKLQVAGAHYTGSKLEKDGNIITGSGANSAHEFADAVLQAA